MQVLPRASGRAGQLLAAPVVVALVAEQLPVALPVLVALPVAALTCQMDTATERKPSVSGLAS